MKKTLLLLALAVVTALSLSAQPRPGSFTPSWKKGPAWLKDAVIYQVYPSSFKDSDGNGIGDIPGVISKLDYIKRLGVDVIWFNPIFESGWTDGGYDVIDFYKVDPRFGTNDDLRELVAKAHGMGIRVMLDLVAGHSSDKNAWFIESSRGPGLPHSDYYIWSDRLPDKKAEKDLERLLADSDPVHNTLGKWMKADAPRAKYYMKNFYPCQPALNYGYAKPDPNHPWEQGVDAPGPRAVREELKRIIGFWYGLGVDGFRVDMAPSLVKNDKDKSAIMALWREVRAWSDAHYPDHVLMAEWNNPPFCLGGGFNVDMCLNGNKTPVRRLYFDKKHQADGGCYFSLNGGQPALRDLYGVYYEESDVDRSATPASMLKTWYDSYTQRVAWTKDWGYYAVITGNHDHLRFNTGERNSPEQLKVMMAWVMTMPLPILYYGDEIGMRSLVGLPNVEGANHNGKERAGARTPMQWDGSANAGFSTCAPEKLYLPVCPEWTPATCYADYLKWKASGARNPTAKGAITVESQEGDALSMLNWTRSLIRLRKAETAFQADSDFQPVFDAARPYPMVYLRTDGKTRWIVALNPTGKKLSVRPAVALPSGARVTPALCSGKASCKADGKGTLLTMGPTSVLIAKLP